MAQNIYDDESFFDAYAALPRSAEGLAAAPEWPALRDLLPPLGGTAVADLGCGYGWFARWAAANGAASVVGYDLSRRMLDRAMSMTDDPRIEYRQADLETLELPEHRFGLVFSSLTLHYLPEFELLVDTVYRALVPGGSFAFSIEHPVHTAPSAPGFVTLDGRTIWPLDHYFERGVRVTDWLAPGVRKYHRTVGDHLAALLQRGFVIDGFVEWSPSPDDLAAHPKWAPEVERPAFLLISAQRRAEPTA